MTRFALLSLVAVLVSPSALWAQGADVEVSQLGEQEVKVHVHPWLKADELATLRVVATNEQALGLFVTRQGRFAAMAVAPEEGLIRDGAPVASAVAMSDLPSAAAAAKAALEGCEANRKGGAKCEIVLEVAPKK